MNHRVFFLFILLYVFQIFYNGLVYLNNVYVLYMCVHVHTHVKGMHVGEESCELVAVQRE